MISTARGMPLLLFVFVLTGPLPAAVATAPAQAWGRQLGTAVNDFAGAIAVDAAGNCVIGGASSGDLAGRNAGKSDAVVARFDSRGQLVWSRQLGTPEADGIWAVALAANGDVIVSGDTAGKLGRVQFGKNDGFLARLDASGRVVWIEQYGSAQDDSGRALACDAAGGIFVAGSTSAQPDGTALPARDAFVRKFDAEGHCLWVRHWGTDADEEVRSIGIGPAGALFVTGSTAGDLGGHGNAGKTDIFVTKLAPDGSVVWTRQFGTPAPETGMKLVVDRSGAVYVGGSSGGDLASPQAGQGDAVLLKLTADGELVWKRQFGTVRWDGIHGLALTPDGRIIVGGCQNWDQCQAFLREFDADGNELWQTTVATKEIICGTQIGLDAHGNIFQVGGTHGPAFGPYAGKDNDMFLVKLSAGAPPAE